MLLVTQVQGADSGSSNTEHRGTNPGVLNDAAGGPTVETTAEVKE